MAQIFNRSRETYSPASTTLRANGNLTYLEFIRLVERIWREAHPSIPIVPMGRAEAPAYPSIVYSLELRKVHPSDPKPQYRETRYTTPGADIIVGQRFQNVINFSAVSEHDPYMAEELIEVFEDFMLEYTPVFKELGLSEIVYGRRQQDKMESRQGSSVSMRTVSYLVTTEKIITTRHSVLEDVTIVARRFLENDRLVVASTDSGTAFDPSPRSYLYGDQIHLDFFVTQEDIDGAPQPDQVTIHIPQSNFRIGDRIYLIPDLQATPTNHGIESGYYIVTGIVDHAPYSSSMGYTIQEWNYDVATPSVSPINIEGPIEGKVYFLPEELMASLGVIDTNTGG